MIGDPLTVTVVLTAIVLGAVYLESRYSLFRSLGAALVGGLREVGGWRTLLRSLGIAFARERFVEIAVCEAREMARVVTSASDVSFARIP